jgi:hypothetical protein
LQSIGINPDNTKRKERHLKHRQHHPHSSLFTFRQVKVSNSQRYGSVLENEEIMSNQRKKEENGKRERITKKQKLLIYHRREFRQEQK